MNTFSRSIMLLACATVLPSLGGAAEQDPDGFHGMLAPYLLAASLDGDVSIGRVSDVPVAVDTQDIFSHLDIGGMVHGELWYQRWGLMAEFVGMRLEDTVQAGRPYATGGVQAKVEITEIVYEFEAARRFILDHGILLDAFAGVRVWDMSTTIDLSGARIEKGISGDESWVDPLVGARVIVPLSTHWMLASRADIGGFGVGSDLSINASVDVGYAIASWFTLEAGYKALWVDYDNGGNGNPGTFVYNVLTHGLRVGAVFGF